ncbi:Methyl-CpG-binding domain-containing protein 8 [Senna tora]|uniref:Methyl-CpG-binding domain-containing protein 8 n=1 Tax=Senna tora TaxID=362788 RepID=A0A834SJR7_9FABA|nr:Methyl-CpG-binding domain-containing protein 8 [Senna tora]
MKVPEHMTYTLSESPVKAEKQSNDCTMEIMGVETPDWTRFSSDVGITFSWILELTDASFVPLNPTMTSLLLLLSSSCFSSKLTSPCEQDRKILLDWRLISALNIYLTWLFLDLPHIVPNMDPHMTIVATPFQKHFMAELALKLSIFNYNTISNRRTKPIPPCCPLVNRQQLIGLQSKINKKTTLCISGNKSTPDPPFSSNPAEASNQLAIHPRNLRRPQSSSSSSYYPIVPPNPSKTLTTLLHSATPQSFSSTLQQMDPPHSPKQKDQWQPYFYSQSPSPYSIPSNAPSPWASSPSSSFVLHQISPTPRPLSPPFRPLVRDSIIYNLTVLYVFWIVIGDRRELRSWKKPSDAAAVTGGGFRRGLGFAGSGIESEQSERAWSSDWERVVVSMRARDSNLRACGGGADGGAVVATVAILDLRRRRVWTLVLELW